MKYQLVTWFPKFKIGFEKSTNRLSVVYDWYLYLGFWELRKWHQPFENVVQRFEDYYKP